MTLRILQATLGYYPAVGWGGPVKIVHQNAMEMRRRGHEVTVVTSNLLDKRRRLQNHSFVDRIDGIPVHYLNTYNFPFWPGTLGPTWLPASARNKLKQLIAGSDVVHVNSTRNVLSINTIDIALEMGKPIVLQPHGTLQHIVSSIRLKQLYDNYFLRDKLPRIDAFIAGQEHEVKQLMAAGVSADHIHIVANGLDTRFLDQQPGQTGILRLRYNIPENAQVILFLGRINRKKGTDLLIKAYANLPEPYRNSRYLIVAGPDDGQLNEALALVEDFDLRERVYFPGLLNGNEVWSAYADADVFVLPCRTDTFPMAVIEACAARVPMVVTDTCEIAGILDGEAAKIVPPDVTGIAEGIRQVLDDEELRQSYRQGAARLMEQVFSIEAVGKALEEIYLQVATSK